MSVQCGIYTCEHDTVRLPNPLPDAVQAAAGVEWGRHYPSLVKPVVAACFAANIDKYHACRIVADVLGKYHEQNGTDFTNPCVLVHMAYAKIENDRILSQKPAEIPAARAEADGPANAPQETVSYRSWRPGVVLRSVKSTERDFAETYNQVMEALLKWETKNPSLFAHGSDIVVAGYNKLKVLDQPLMVKEISDRVQFYVIGKDRDGKERPKVAGAPTDVVAAIRSAGDTTPLPKVDRVSYTPFFAADGTLQSTPGYHAGARTLYISTTGVTVPPIPNKPTLDDTEAAKTLLMDELFGDFPFATKADKANLIALNLAPYVQAMIEGPRPLYGIDASTPGTGKGLLLALSTGHTTGNHYKVTPAPDRKEEWAKSLVAMLREGVVTAAFDNVNHKVDSGALASAITAWPTCSSRIMGVSENVDMPAPAAWALAGNNLTFSDENARRVVHVRLDAQMERPEERTGFRHPNILRWAKDNQGRIIAACLTLIQSWVAAGQPDAPATPVFGTFEEWTRVLAGILHYVGIDGFLTNRTEFLNKADEDGARWRRFVNAWIEHGIEGTASIVLNTLCSALKVKTTDEDGEETTSFLPLVDPPIDLDLSDGITKSVSTRFGTALRKHEGRWYGDHRINSRTDGKTVTWYLSTRNVSN